MQNITMNGPSINSRETSRQIFFLMIFFFKQTFWIIGYSYFTNMSNHFFYVLHAVQYSVCCSKIKIKKKYPKAKETDLNKF